MTSYERWSLVASFGSLLVSVVAFGALAWQLLMLARGTAQDHDRRRKQATMEYLTAIMDRRKALYDEGIPDERDHAAVSALISRALAGDPTAVHSPRVSRPVRVTVATAASPSSTRKTSPASTALRSRSAG
ncbi:hypothetical protein [Streptomyces sp. NPDC006997]|uniref:hypothetical protein n=1 Tax=Streptomyces sp. NPDC006997 TaxID=3155356 RepID=UPI00340948D4